MTRKWTYTLTTPEQAAALVDSPDHRVWSAAWRQGIEKGAAFVVVASVATAVPPDGPPLAGVEVAADKDPWPPPPPPPPATSVKDFSAALSMAMGGAAPRSID